MIEHDQPPRVRKRQGRNHDAMHESKDCGRGANRKAERDECRGGEARRAAQPADGKSHLFHLLLPRQAQQPQLLRHQPRHQCRQLSKSEEAVGRLSSGPGAGGPRPKSVEHVGTEVRDEVRPMAADDRRRDPFKT